MMKIKEFGLPQVDYIIFDEPLGNRDYKDQMINCFEKYKFWNSNCFHKNFDNLEMIIETNIKKLSTEELQKLLDNIDNSNSSSISLRRSAFRDNVLQKIE